MIRLHASAVALQGRGVLLRGPSGSGKSDLALRLIDAGAMLVADDQTELRRVEAGLELGPAGPLEGLLEVRGLGILRMPWCRAPLHLVVDLGEEDRLPEPRMDALLGCAVPRLALDPRPASAAIKLRLALAQGGVGPPPSLGWEDARP